MKVGVYGTLKKGFGANGMLATSRFVKSGYFQIPYQMYDLGAFPALVPDSKMNKIFLEIYDVDRSTMQQLDRYEGYPNLYKKHLINLEEDEVTIYVGGDSINNQIETCNIVENGKY